MKFGTWRYLLRQTLERVLVYGIAYPVAFIFEYWFVVVLLLGIIGFGYLTLKAGEQARDSRTRLTFECEARGGFLMRTADEYVCLDKSLKR